MIKQISYVIVLALLLAGCTSMKVAGVQSLGKEEKESMLKETIAANWQAMVERDRAKMYDLYDPFFRARVGKAWFIGQDMPIYYHSYELVAVDIKGNVAKADTKVVYSIKHMGKLGKEIKRDNTETIVKDTWLFIDNRWQRQYYDNITDGTFANY